MFDVPSSEKYSIRKTLPKKEIKHLLRHLGGFPFIVFVFYKRFSRETDLRRLFSLPAQIWCTPEVRVGSVAISLIHGPYRVGDLIRWHDMKFHLYADNTQL